MTDVQPGGGTRLHRLVLFMIAVSVAGCLIAGIHYFYGDRPQQETQSLPDVSENMTAYNRCTGGCISTNVMYISPDGPQNPTDDACVQTCREKYLRP